MIDFASTGQFFRMCSQVLEQIEEIDPDGKEVDFFKILVAKHIVTDQEIRSRSSTSWAQILGTCSCKIPWPASDPRSMARA